MTHGRHASSTWMVALVAAWIALPANAALWIKLERIGALGALHAATMLAIVWGGVAALLSLFAWRWTLKPAAIVLLLVSGLAAHFMLAYGVVMDPGMLANALQTDLHEAGGLLGWRLVGVVSVLVLLPTALLLRRPVAYAPPARQALRNGVLFALALLVLAVAAIAGFQPLASVMRNHKEVRYLVNPLASLYSLGRVATKPLARDESRLVPVGADARLAAGGRPAILLLVLGETARSDHFALNHYGRDTTPELARAGVVSFRNAWACGTSTAASVPCMFSHLGRDGYEARQARHETVLDVLQRAGLAVLWIDNQAGCKGVCDRVPNVTTDCARQECLDEAMLQDLDARIARLEPARVARGVVVVLHQMGSHGPAYWRRSPAQLKPFAPECTSASLADCPREAVVNAYDNSIRYTDHFLGQAIAWLKAREGRADSALLYVSDHGESLGEGNLYLHGMPYVVSPDAQKHVPWITWASAGFQRSRHLSIDCLRARSDQAISHDHYFHSVLGLMGVGTSAYRPELDAYGPCRAAASVVAPATTSVERPAA